MERGGAHLQAHYVDQRLVGDVDLAQDLSDWDPGDQPVERHKQSEDRSQPGGGGRKKSRGWGRHE